MHSLQPGDVEMLDAFIIDRIRQQQIRHKESQIPLRIEAPETEPPTRPEEQEKDKQERGVVIIDFSI
jgi:hypothetical protein